MSDRPTLEVPENYAEQDHNVKVVLLANNSLQDLRAAVDGIIGRGSSSNPSTVQKAWMAEVLLALGGVDAAPADVEVGDD